MEWCVPRNWRLTFDVIVLTHGNILEESFLPTVMAQAPAVGAYLHRKLQKGNVRHTSLRWQGLPAALPHRILLQTE